MMEEGEETAWPIGSLLPTAPKTVLALDRGHRRIGILHRDRDRTLGEDLCTNRLDHTPRVVFTLPGATRALPERIATSPTRAIEMIRDQRNGAPGIPAGRKLGFHRIFLVDIKAIMAYLPTRKTPERSSLFPEVRAYARAFRVSGSSV